MSFRASTGNLALVDEPRRGPERWDRDKFERFSRRAADDRDYFRFEEHDRFGGGRGHRDVEFEERIARRGPNGRVEEKERYVEEDRYGPPSRRRPEFLDRPDHEELAHRSLAPYRRKSIAERDVDISIRRPARPHYIRRQSSLDTFDRRRPHRYSEKDHDDWRPPTNVPIPLPIRRRSPSRRHSPPSNRYKEEDYEEIRYRDVESDGREDEYRDIRIKRERSRRRRKSRARSRRSSSTSSSSSFEEISPVREHGKRGHTRMPKRLVHKSAIVELGYPFEEEDDFFIVRRALEKEQIDEVIRISEQYKDNRTTYRYEEKQVKEIEVPPPPVSAQYHNHHHHHHPPPAHSVRSASPQRHEYIAERVEESNHISGPLTVLVPDRNKHRSEHEIQAEIRQLERERRDLRFEREGESARYRETDYEFIESREPEKNVVRIDRDRKGKKPPNPKIVAAMMATLS